MAKIVNNTKEKKMSWSAQLLSKLHLAPDMSVNREPVETGMFRHWWNVLRSNMTSMFLNNIMFLLFVLPLFALVLFVMPNLEKRHILEMGYNFVGDLGFGFTGATNDSLLALHDIYIFRILFHLIMIPCFTLAGVGAAGLFYCMRNKAWGADVKVRIHFFRGIKKYWWQFMLAFTVLGIEVYGIVASIHAYLLLSIGGATAPWWIWLVMVFSCLLTLLTVIFLTVYLSTVTMYREKHRYIIKNAIILSAVTILPALIILIMLTVPTLLSLFGFGQIVLMVFFALYGFAMYALAIQCFGLYCADNFTKILYEQSILESQKERRRQNSRGKKKKAAGKKR